MGKFLTSIDFGSSKTVVAVGQRQDDGMHIVFWKSAPSDGVKFGEINNITKCARVLKSLIEEAQEAIGETITEAVTTISGRKLESCEEKIDIDRAFPSSAISVNEIKTITENQYRCDTEGMKVLEVAPQQYNIDEVYNVEFNDLEGMRGKTIEAYFKTFIGKQMLVENRKHVLMECGIRMQKAILSPVASARAVLTEQEKEKGVVLIDFGKDLTEIAIIRNNVVRDVRVIPFAGESVTRDISNVAEVSNNWAEAIKVRHGYCLEEICPENKTLELINSEGEQEGEVDLLLLTRIIEARVSEIFDAVKYFVSQNKYDGKLTSGYVLTGGSAYLSYILPLAKTILGAKVRLAAPRGCISSDSIKEAFDAGSSASIGLILEQESPMLSTATKQKAQEEAVKTPVAKKPVKPEKPVTKVDLEDLEEDIEEEKNQEKPESTSGNIFNILRHHTSAPKPAPAPAKPKENKEKKTVTFLGSIFNDDGNGNNA